MKRKRHFPGVVIATMLSFPLAACETPPDVLELTSKTSVNVALVGRGIQDFADTNKQLTEARAKEMAQLDRLILGLSYDKDELDAMRLAGEFREVKVYENLVKHANKATARFLAAVETEKTRRQEILATQADLSVPSKELASVSKKLAALAKKETAKDRIKFLIGFVKSVNDEIEEAKKAQKKAESKVKDKLDQKSRDVGQNPGDGG